MSSSAAAVPSVLHPTFISKYKPQLFSDFHFSTDAEFMAVLRGVLSLSRIHVLFIADADSCKTTFLYAFLREYFGNGGAIHENNVLFINNLREQGINYFRNEMKIFCQSYSNVPGKKKVVAIDDLDGVNEQSQQVFRNYIDKYGHNVNFIAVCSSMQKVIESIQSRLQFFRIMPLERPHMSQLLARVAKREGLALDPACAQFLLNICGLSCRPMLNYLEKISVLMGDDKKRVSLAFCRNICTDINPQTFATYFADVRDGRLSSAIEALFGLHGLGFSVLDILDSLFFYMKTTEDLTETQKYCVIPFLCKYITVFHNVHEDKIELAFFTNRLSAELARIAERPSRASALNIDECGEILRSNRTE